ncbi:hypothetical protein [Rheinheimera sp.]|uniref:hypothetical protein n=1 Tax=Rheinheimera sp. TaxID=1869214 RepID=UPI004048B206
MNDVNSGMGNAVLNIRIFAQELIAHKLTTGQLKDMFEELSEYRKLFEELLGEQSVEYQIANAMLVLSRALRSNSDSSLISHWVNKYPLYSTWFLKVEELLDVKPKWKYGYKNEIVSQQQISASS